MRLIPCSVVGAQTALWAPLFFSGASMSLVLPLGLMPRECRLLMLLQPRARWLDRAS